MKQSHEHLEGRTQWAWIFLAAEAMATPRFGSRGVSVPSAGSAAMPQARRGRPQSHGTFTHVLALKRATAALQSLCMALTVLR